jgi:DNA-binding transcriptional MerR regulator
VSTNHPLPRDFIGTVRVIADTADDLLVQAGIGTPGQVTERLVRFYVSTQLLDAPTKDGREAIYGALQLAKLVAVRVLLSGGLSLSRIKEIVATADIEMCERLLDPETRSQEMAAQERRRAEEINRNVQPRAARSLDRATRSMDRSLLTESQPVYSVANQAEGVLQSSIVAESGPLDDLDSDLIELAHLLLERPAILENLLAGNGAPQNVGPRRQRTVTWNIADGIDVLIEPSSLNLTDTRQIKALEAAFGELLRHEYQLATASKGLLAKMKRLQESMVWLMSRDRM